MIFYIFTSGSYNEKLWGTLINFMKSFNFIMKTSKLKTYGPSIELFLYVSFWSGIYFQSSYNVKIAIVTPTLPLLTPLWSCIRYNYSFLFSFLFSYITQELWLVNYCCFFFSLVWVQCSSWSFCLIYFKEKQCILISSAEKWEE